MSLPAVLLTLRREKRRLAFQAISSAQATAAGMSGSEARKEHARLVLAEADENIDTEHPADIARDFGIPQAT